VEGIHDIYTRTTSNRVRRSRCEEWVLEKRDSGEEKSGRKIKAEELENLRKHLSISYAIEDSGSYVCTGIEKGRTS
jgi:hypothetical protein